MMTPDLLRWLDRHLGRLLCALLRLCVRRDGRRGLLPPPAPRVLFIELAEMGSIVVADPVLRRVRDQHAGTVHFLTLEQNRAALDVAASIPPSRVFGLRAGHPGQLLVDSLRFIVWARRERFDVVIDLEFMTAFSAALAFLSGAPLRAGFSFAAEAGGGRASLYTHRVPFRASLHAGLNFAALVDAVFGGRRSLAMPIPQRRRFAVDELRSARNRLPDPGGNQRRVLLNPNCGDLVPQRRWPAAAYIEFARRLLADFADLQVLVLGGPRDIAFCAELADAIADPRCASIAGRFAVGELPALYTVCDLLVSNDSGPAHFASVTSIPAIVLFGPESPQRFRPLGQAIAISANLPCSPCIDVAQQRRTACRNNLCMQSIGVGEVYGQAAAMLEAAAAGRAA